LHEATVSAAVAGLQERIARLEAAGGHAGEVARLRGYIRKAERP
jgi:hypothetical protein